MSNYQTPADKLKSAMSQPGLAELVGADEFKHVQAIFDKPEDDAVAAFNKFLAEKRQARAANQDRGAL